MLDCFYDSVSPFEFTIPLGTGLHSVGVKTFDLLKFQDFDIFG